MTMELFLTEPWKNILVRPFQFPKCFMECITIE